MTLIGHTAIVTGAGSGIGRAIAIALAEQGAALALIGRNQPALDATAAEAQQYGRPVSCLHADLADPHSVAVMLEELQRTVASIDILVHSAGIFASGRLDQSSVDDLDRQYAINLRAPFLLTQALLPALRARPGQIVFINSSAAGQARAGIGQYAATKAGLRALADSLREEVNADGIRVLSVYPGRTAGPMQAAIYASEGRAYQPERLIQPADIAAAVVHALLLPRTAEITDLAIRPLQKPL